MGYKEGRSELAPEVHNITQKQKCIRFNSTSSKVTHRTKSKATAQARNGECKQNGITKQCQTGKLQPAKLPTGDVLPREEHLCGKLNYSMYGTRRAATNWQTHYTKVLVQNGFTTGLANNCTFHNSEKNIYCMVHGDGFVSTGTGKSLELLESVLSKEFKIKTSMMGPDKNDNKEIKMLNRIIKYTSSGIELEADLRHAELIVSQLGLENAKELTCPSAEEVKRDDDDELLNQEYTTQ